MSDRYTAEMAHTAVARGAAWLDRRYPDWAREINIHVLDLHNTDFCILGQTADVLIDDIEDVGERYEGVLNYFAPVARRRWAARYGFDLPRLEDERSDKAWKTYPIYYEMLTVAWKELIRQRLESRQEAQR